jgi:voltage-gated potassium channel
MLQWVKRRAYEILETPEQETPIDKYFNYFIIGMVLLNIAAVILETEASLFDKYGYLFYAFDILSAIVFTVEYLTRLWCCTENPQYAHPILGRLRYAVKVMSLIDLLAVLPFYLQFLPALRVLRILRIARIFRLLKLVRYSDATDTLARVVINKKEELLITLSLGVGLIIISSTLVYYAECDAQPDKFSSILSSMWWSVVTLATVGYGDVYPVTALGRFFGALTSLFGIGLFALPTALIGSGFIEELQRKRDSSMSTCPTICPHCGKNIHEPPQAPQVDDKQPVAIVVEIKK